MNDKNPLIKSEPSAEEIAEKAARIRKKWSKAEYFRRAADRMPQNWNHELENRDSYSEETADTHFEPNAPCSVENLDNN